ncbi:MAG TPA: MBL fold metallo-hydrolase [Cytophagales bacterium]|nr:MBL fold metallo-hydrolase [Cytophagales bacterium]
MKVTFLGTGTSQGVPVIGCDCKVCQSLDYRDKRLRSSVHVELDEHSFVIDTGPDFRQQMLRERTQRLDFVLFTHSHKDHTAGLDDVRAFNFKQNMDMPLFGTRQVLDQLKTEYYYAFLEKKYPGTPQLQLNEINDDPFEVNGITITPLPVTHLHMPVLGFRIKDFSYITDANFIPDGTFKRLKGTKVLVLNALQKKSHISHFNLTEAVEIAKKVGAEKTYFTHISHNLGLHKNVSEELPESIELAQDSLVISL